MNIHIAGFGAGLPEQKVTNHELPKSIDTTDEWIVSHTGISSRYVASKNESSASLATKAAQEALKMSGVKPEEVGMVIVATSTPDYNVFPSCACLVQHHIGAVNAGAFDLLAACSGFVYAMQVARSMMLLDPRPMVVVGTDVMTRTVDWTDRNTCVLFGDGAGAVVLKAEDRSGGLLQSVLRSDGGGERVLYCDGGYRHPKPENMVPGYLHMDGKKVFNFAVKACEEVIRDLAQKQGISLDQIAWVVPHQANFRILDAAARRLGIDMSRFYMNISELANTSSATVPLALAQMSREGRFKSGDYIALVGFGAGLTWGGVLVQI
jgi:3-oxoacyl-[acyl-carrier-protein] synthase-3